MDKGDYVLASKYDDGDPGDHYCVGFYAGNYDHFGQTRHLVNDADGKPFRANGFRRCELVSTDEGARMIASFPDLKPLRVEEGGPGEDDRLVGESVWDRLAAIRAQRT